MKAPDGRRRRTARPFCVAVTAPALAFALLGGCASPGDGAGAAAPPAPEPPMEEPAPIEAGQAPPPGPYAPGVDVLDYRIELDLRDGTDEIAGTARLLVRRTAEEPGRVSLDLTGLAVDSVFVGAQAYRGLERVPSDVYRDSLSAGRLPVPFPDASAVGDTLGILVHYRGTPDDGLILGTTPRGQPSAFADNWPNRARFWFPSVDHPSDKATVGFVVRAPREWEVVANGALLSPPTPVVDPALEDADGIREAARRTWRWRTDAPIPTYTMVVGAATFVRRPLGLAACGRAPLSTRGDGCLEVTAWLYPPDTAQANRSFRRATEMVQVFADLIGPYPYEKLAHVQASTRFGGMENASAIFYPADPLAAGRDIEDVVAHETAHQWFGDSVTESDWHHLWLSEGFAEYFEAVFHERADGSAAFRRSMEEKRRTYLASGAASRPVIDEEEDDLFALLNPNSYQKGAWVLHMLRGILGDETFFRGIRDYYAAHVSGTALTADFRSAMEDAAGRPLEWFFDQWLRRPGHPVIASEVTWNPDRATARITLRQEQPPSWPTFRLPAVLEVVTESGETVRQAVELSERAQEFEVALPGPPARVTFDPDGWVLAQEAGGGR